MFDDLLSLELKAQPRLRGDGDESVNAGMVGRCVVPGVANGVLATSIASAARFVEKGLRCIVAVKATGPMDTSVISKCAGLITSESGDVSHASVIAKSLGIPCLGSYPVSAIGDGFVRTSPGNTVHDGSEVSVCATTGRVFAGPAETYSDAEANAAWNQRVKESLEFLDQSHKAIYANADTPQTASACFALGAKGVGVARTEHMLRDASDVEALKMAVLGENSSELAGVLYARLNSLIEACAGRVLTMRYLDPPLNEFFSDDERFPREVNPMMGLRGARLGVVVPRIYEVQTEVLLSLRGVISENEVSFRAMFPLVNWADELRGQHYFTQLCNDELFALGAMVETPHAALTAGRLKGIVSFFSVGTNDLNQFCLGLSRDDAYEEIIPSYLERGIVEEDELGHLTRGSGTMSLLSGFAEGIRGGEWGVCGEHAGDPKSIWELSSLQPRYLSVGLNAVERCAVHWAEAIRGVKTS